MAKNVLSVRDKKAAKMVENTKNLMKDEAVSQARANAASVVTMAAGLK